MTSCYARGIRKCTKVVCGCMSERFFPLFAPTPARAMHVFLPPPSELIMPVQLHADASHDVLCSGRLMHHLQEVEGMSLRTVQVCIFDEADRLFEMGFAEQLKAILGRLSEARQTLLFSATMPAGLAEFARAGLKEPQFVRLDAESQLSPDLTLAFFTVR